MIELVGRHRATIVVQGNHPVLDWFGDRHRRPDPVLYPATQMVAPMLAWVTFGSMAPGVRDGSGSTPGGPSRRGAVTGAAVLGVAVSVGAIVGGTVRGADDAVVVAGCCPAGRAR